MKADDIPVDLLLLENGCGPVSAWLALRHFKKRLSYAKVAKRCGHSKPKSTFAICIAVALKKCGIKVEFSTEEDNDKKQKEVRGYNAAKRLGIPIHPAMTIGELRDLVRRKVVIVLFNSKNGEGHFSPIQSMDKKFITFAFANEPILPLPVFNARWRAQSVCRQAIILG